MLPQGSDIGAGHSHNRARLAGSPRCRPRPRVPGFPDAAAPQGSLPAARRRSETWHAGRVGPRAGGARTAAGLHGPFGMAPATTIATGHNLYQQASRSAAHANSHQRPLSTAPRTVALTRRWRPAQAGHERTKVRSPGRARHLPAFA
jgi:hypothetical protein